MRESFAHLEQYRLRKGRYKSEPGDRFGAFMIPLSGEVAFLAIAASSDIETEEVDQGWEHVSLREFDISKTQVNPPERTPSWNTMCRAKELFFEQSETVIQFHPAVSKYVNLQKNCLHLWHNRIRETPLPPQELV